MLFFLATGAAQEKEPSAKEPRELKSEGTPVPNPTKGPATLPPEEDEALRVKIDTDLFDFYKYVEDDAPLRNDGEDERDAGEHKAYNYTIAKAHKLPLDLMARHSKKNVPFANLIKPIRQDYQRELIRIEGRLARLVSMKSTDFLRKTEGLKELYEGWVFPVDEEFPVCILFTELPENLKLGQKIENVWVAFDGYYFKLFHYETVEKAKGKNLWRRAPLVIGRSPVKTASPYEADTGFSFSNYLVPVIVLLLSVMIGTALFLSMRYRRGDKQVQAQLRDTQYQTNPFQVEQLPPQVEPGTAWNRLGPPPQT